MYQISKLDRKVALSVQYQNVGIGQGKGTELIMKRNKTGDSLSITQYYVLIFSQRSTATTKYLPI